MFDFSYLSSYDKDNLKKIRNKTFRKDYDLGKRELDFWQKICPSVLVLQGNHDERVDRLILREPRWEGVIEVEEELDFKERGINYYRQIEPPVKLGHLHLIHGWYHNIHHARKHLDEMGGNVCYGHLHTFQTFSRRLPAYNEEIAAWCLGCLTDKQPDWVKGRPTRWSNGFAVVYLGEDGNFNLYPIRIINNQFMWENHLFVCGSVA